MTDIEPIPAVVYLNAAQSDSPAMDEVRVRRLAKRYGYQIVSVLRVVDGGFGSLVRLAAAIREHKADAVFVPTVDHLEGQIDQVMREADVIDLHGGCFARWHPIAEALGDISLLEHRDPSEAP